MTGTPTNITFVRTGKYTVQLSWSAPANNTPSVAGYEVFYAVSGSNSTQSGATTTSTTVNVTLPTLDVMYDLYVVAFSDADNALPSAHSNYITMSEFYFFHRCLPTFDIAVFMHNLVSML